MLMQEWILARPEFREFLPSRMMVPYPEPWMERVDSMLKKLQGAGPTSRCATSATSASSASRSAAVARFGSRSDVNRRRNTAANWARFWRQEIQWYIHAYRSVTGVDLTIEVTDPVQASARYLPPAVHLRNRLAVQHRQQLAAGGGYSDALALSMRPPVRRGLRRV